MKQKFTLFTVITISFFISVTQSYGQLPKQEKRSAWLTTVWGLDWPKTKIPAGGGMVYINQQKQQLIRILDSMKVTGLNSVFFQVRPEADSFYPSSYEPWSAHLVEQRGMNPGYDPLEFAIEECHNRGLELHAWLNPYRFESVAGKYSGQEGDYRNSNPEWVLSYSGGGSILDPGNPEVRERISAIVKEIVVNYDVDGIVFDDYFYAYGGTPSTLDQFSQNNWKPLSMNLHDWRRDNINRMIAGVYQTIKENKQWVQFGVSPFGIWTIDSQVAASYGLTLPQGITGMDAYKTIYADPVAWLSEGTVDYISPQLYWPTTSVGQDYKKLAPWWSEVVSRFGRHLYVSHSLSDLDESDYPPPVALKSAYSNFLETSLKGLSMIEYFSQLSSKSSVAGFDPSEVGQQIQWNRVSDKNQAPGSVFFRSSMFFIQGFINYLRSNEYAYKALPPAIFWNDIQERTLPSNLRIEEERFVWASQENNVRYAVYAVPELMIHQRGLFSDATYLLGMSYQKEFSLSEFPDLLSEHIFAVSVFDRNGNEFPPVMMGMGSGANQPAVLISPADGQNAHSGFSFTWNDIPEAESYLLEISSDSSFTSLINRRQLTETTINSDYLHLDEDSVYYWRILTRMANTNDTSSAIRSFRLSPGIIYPYDEMTNVEVTPVIEWETFGDALIYRLQVSTNKNFSDPLFNKETEGNSLELPPGVIFPYSTYYIKLEASGKDSLILWSDVVRFSTVSTPPSIPAIIAPSDGETIYEPEVTISVEEDHLAKSITYQLSNSETFPWNNRFQYTRQSPEYNLVLENLEEGSWYVKARANYSSSLYTNWSETVSFSMLTTSSTPVTANNFSLDLPVFSAPETMNIRYFLPAASKVKIYITSLTGIRTEVADKSFKNKGKHTISWSCHGIQPGIYLLTLETNNGRKTVKMIKAR